MTFLAEVQASVEYSLFESGPDFVFRVTQSPTPSFGEPGFQFTSPEVKISPIEHQVNDPGQPACVPEVQNASK